LYLTEKEQAMLAGKEGPLVQKCMKVLVTLGEIYGADRMLEVTSVHSPGVSYRVAGDAGLEYVKDASEQGKFLMNVTTNPIGIDSEDWEKVGFPKDFSMAQIELDNAYEKMGALANYTCTPYITSGVPRFGEHVAWGESSAIAFVNSVIGARTNREGGPSALAAGVTGRVPNYGYHLDTNRKATYVVKVEYDLKTDRDYAAMGYAIGQIVGRDVPVFVNAPQHPTLESLKALGAALASSGAVALFHIVGVTPEAPTLEAVLADKYETVVFGKKEYDEVSEKFALTQPADFVVIGCPHCSINELKTLAEMLDGKKVKVDTWICTARQTKAMSDKMGYTKTITDSGALIVCDTCPVLCPTLERGYKMMATNSGKMAHYARGLWNLNTALLQLEDCIAAAL
jgi:predicted aconitase